MSYDSLFFGRNIFDFRPEEGRASVGNCQKLGVLAQDRVAVLRPDRSYSFYSCDLWAENLHRIDEDLPELLDDATAAYQAAYLLYSRGLLKETVIEGGVPRGGE